MPMPEPERFDGPAHLVEFLAPHRHVDVHGKPGRFGVTLLDVQINGQSTNQPAIHATSGRGLSHSIQSRCT
jgi:hypothetical protein